MLPKHSRKTFSVKIFSSKHVSVWCQKKQLHCTISWCSRTTFLKHFESKCLYISVYISKNILFQRLSKILSGGMGGWGRLNTFLKAACCLVLVKYFARCFTPDGFKVFTVYLIEIFWNSEIFQYFDAFINSIKTLKFSRQFGLRRKDYN